MRLPEQAHTLPTQVCCAPQVVAQSPQWLELVDRSTQVPPQFVCPDGQPTHLPPEQEVPLAQILPQAPQLAELALKSTQSPEQSV